MKRLALLLVCMFTILGCSSAQKIDKFPPVPEGMKALYSQDEWEDVNTDLSEKSRRSYVEGLELSGGDKNLIDYVVSRVNPYMMAHRVAYPNTVVGGKYNKGHLIESIESNLPITPGDLAKQYNRPSNKKNAKKAYWSLMDTPIKVAAYYMIGGFGGDLTELKNEVKALKGIDPAFDADSILQELSRFEQEYVPNKTPEVTASAEPAAKSAAPAKAAPAPKAVKEGFDFGKVDEMQWADQCDDAYFPNEKSKYEIEDRVEEGAKALKLSKGLFEDGCKAIYLELLEDYELSAIIGTGSSQMLYLSHRPADFLDQ
jgi:hypothetical protein